MPTTTTNYSLNKPLINDPIDEDLWGNYINGDMDSLDTLLRAGITVAVAASQTTGFTASASISTKNLYPCDATSAAFAATLPTAASAGNGATVYFKKTDSTTHAVTVTRASSDTIDGATTKALSAQYDFVGLVSDGVSAWSVVCSSGIPLNSPAFTGTPTAPTAAAGTSTTQLATTAFVFAQFTQSLGANGYQKFPNGLILQWGNSSLTSHQTKVITFPTAFTTSCDFAIVSAGTTSAATYPLAVASFNSTTVSIYNSDGGTTQTAYWLAIGH